jgi:FkbM family methyltransferase
MLSDANDYQKNVIQQVNNIYMNDSLPHNHRNFLYKLRDEYNFVPNVCYDIGACVLHWTRHAEIVWPKSEIFLFDAFEPASVLYTKHKNYVGVLSDIDDKIVKFYQNDFLPGGNSYYREIGSYGNVFPENTYLLKKTRSLDSIVKEKQFLLPDLIKIDVQGAELDILKGAPITLSYATCLIVELQNVQYNLGAPLVDTTMKYLESIGWKCIAQKFSDNGPDADYCFINTNKNHNICNL